MPDYRRLVSYIYNYEDGNKRNNVGYARIEARNGLCKCTLHITAPSLNDKQLKVYFFRRDNGGLDGIQIGTMSIRSGAGDLKVQTNSDRIMNSPYSIEHMGGMVLYLSDSKFFATEWDDQPINMEVVSTLEKKETVKAAEKEPESVKNEKKPELAEANTNKEKEDVKEVETEEYDIKKDSGAKAYEVKENPKTDTASIQKETKTEGYDEKSDTKTETSEAKKEESLKAKGPEVAETKGEPQPVTQEVKKTKEADKGELNGESS